LIICAWQDVPICPQTWFTFEFSQNGKIIVKISNDGINRIKLT
jgi:hypothetical protein